MTVQQLINQLEKMPRKLTVYMADHDHSDYETSSSARNVILVDQSEMSQDEIENHTALKDNREELYSHPKKYVCIRS